MLRLAVLTALVLLVPAAAALAAARPATPAEERAVRAAVTRGSCPLVARFTEVAVSGRDPRHAILVYDATDLADVCTAIVRRASRTARAWRVVEFRRGPATTDRAIRPCPRTLPRDLRRTVQVRGARGPIVYCGN